MGVESGQHHAVPLNEGKGEVVRMNEGAGLEGCGKVQLTWMRAQGLVQLGCRTQKCEDGGQGMGAMENRMSRTLKCTIWSFTCMCSMSGPIMLASVAGWLCTTCMPGRCQEWILKLFEVKIGRVRSGFECGMRIRLELKLS